MRKNRTIHYFMAGMMLSLLLMIISDWSGTIDYYMRDLIIQRLLKSYSIQNVILLFCMRLVPFFIVVYAYQKKQTDRWVKGLVFFWGFMQGIAGLYLLILNGLRGFVYAFIYHTGPTGLYLYALHLLLISKNKRAHQVIDNKKKSLFFWMLGAIVEGMVMCLMSGKTGFLFLNE